MKINPNKFFSKSKKDFDSLSFNQLFSKKLFPKKSKGLGGSILSWMIAGFMMILIVVLFVSLQNMPGYFNQTHTLVFLLLMVIVVMFTLWLFLK